MQDRHPAAGGPRTRSDPWGLRVLNAIAVIECKLVVVECKLAVIECKLAVIEVSLQFVTFHTLTRSYQLQLQLQDGWSLASLLYSAQGCHTLREGGGGDPIRS